MASIITAQTILAAITMPEKLLIFGKHALTRPIRGVA